MEYYFDDIELCEEIGEFEDEYVYDLEINDDTHTFIANDILIHNTDSEYISFEEVYKSVDSWEEKHDPIEFIKLIYKHRLKEYFDVMHERYAAKWNTTNLHEFELEAISYAGIWLAKKKYVLDGAWKAAGKDGIYFEPQTKLSPKGIEIAQTSYPKFVRDSIKDLIDYMFVHGKELDMTDFMSKIKKIKERFKLENIENISLLKNVNVLNDRNGLELVPKCPLNVKAAAIHNYLLNNSKYKSKYNLIKAGSKIKYYYVKQQSKEWEVFGFIPNEFPMEIAPQYDHDLMFEKCILDPINRFMEALGKTRIPNNLVFVKALW